MLAVVHSAFSCRCSQPNPPAPVCATDGNTYDSNCHVGCAPPWPRGKDDPCLTKIYDGKCTTPCNCQDVCDYVCASNGITYGNKCSMECARLKDPSIAFDYMGQCPP